MQICCFPEGSRAWCGVLHGVVGQVWFRLDKVHFSSGHGIDRLTRKEVAAGYASSTFKEGIVSFLFPLPFSKYDAGRLQRGTRYLDKNPSGLSYCYTKPMATYGYRQNL